MGRYVNVPFENATCLRLDCVELRPCDEGCKGLRLGGTRAIPNRRDVGHSLTVDQS